MTTSADINLTELDQALIRSVFFTLNINTDVQSHIDFAHIRKWLESQKSGAICIDEFIHFLTATVDSIKQSTNTKQRRLLEALPVLSPSTDNDTDHKKGMDLDTNILSPSSSPQPSRTSVQNNIIPTFDNSDNLVNELKQIQIALRGHSENITDNIHIAKQYTPQISVHNRLKSIAIKIKELEIMTLQFSVCDYTQQCLDLLTDMQNSNNAEQPNEYIICLRENINIFHEFNSNLIDLCGN